MAGKKKDTKKKTPKKKAAPKKKAPPKKKEEVPREEAPQEEVAAEEVVADAEFKVITKSQDEEVFEAMDLADEEMILAELEGRSEALEHYVYSFQDRTGKMITGLSLAGTREAARALALAGLTNPGLVQPTVPDPPTIIQETPEFIRVHAAGLDQRTGFQWHGFVEQEKFYVSKDTGEPVPRKFAFVIAMSKAQRNALRGLLPEHWIIKMIEQYMKQGKVKALDEERSPEKYVLGGKKHPGKTLEEIQEVDPEYLQWATSGWPNERGKSMVQRFLNQLRADKTPEVLDDGETIKYKGKIIKADAKITSDWYDGLRELIGEAEMHGSHLKNHLKKHYGVTSTAHLTFGQAIPFRQYLEERIAKGGEEPEEPEEESDLDGSEEFEPYAMPEEILELAGEITHEDFDFEEFVVEHIAPHMEIDEHVQKLLFKFLQRLGELEEDEDMGPLTKAFDKGIEQLTEEE